MLTPILRTWVLKSTLLLQNCGHAEVLKKDPFFREIRNEGAAPLCTSVPPPGSFPSLAIGMMVPPLSPGRWELSSFPNIIKKNTLKGTGEKLQEDV